VPAFQPDVVIVDRLMPGLSGDEVLDALRRAARTVPVILMSGNVAGAVDGFFAILEKPFNLQRMAEVVAAAVDRARRGRA
jgi:FixJ family two-component response regulator